MTKDQDTAYVDRIAKFVLGDIDLDKAWFIAASGDIYRRMEALEEEAKTAGFLTCARCGEKLPAPMMIPEEGDRWECASCWKLGDAQDRAEASGAAMLHKMQSAMTRDLAALLLAHNMLSAVYADYSHPNFTDRHGMAPKIRAAIGELESVLWPNGAANKPTVRL